MAKPSNKARLKKLKALLLDVDGVLTDAKQWYAGDGKWVRRFSLRDGYGIRKLIDNGFVVGIITASNSEDIRQRAQHLKIEHFYQGSLDKISQLNDFLKKSGIKENEIAYMGDDEPDVPVMKRVGFAATVPAGIGACRKAAHYITKLEGGDGAVREVCDLIFDNSEILSAAKKAAAKGVLAHGQ
jgi:3-deoxy-D-manno-octulosonate 8-phosphate phosphatase (KDO 8-P phosphatase)